MRLAVLCDIHGNPPALQSLARGGRRSRRGGRTLSAQPPLSQWGNCLDLTFPAIVSPREAPIDTDFEAFLPQRVSTAAWTQFTAALTRRGKGRLDLAAAVLCREVRAASFAGEFVAIRQEK